MAGQLGDFLLERCIGQGGMGEVYLAKQVSLDRVVAVKILPRSLAAQENFMERFQRPKGTRPGQATGQGTAAAPAV